MMCFWRKIYRFAAVTLWFSVLGVMSLPGFFCGRRGIKMNAAVARIWARGLCRILCLRVTLEGEAESFPGGLIISNHLGYLDILAEGSVFPIRFAPKKEIKYWPLLGWFIALSRPIWIDRASRQQSGESAEEITASLRENICTLLYPEGTSTSGRDGLLPFKSTPFEAAIKSEKAFLPVLIRYDLPPDEYECQWYGDMTLWPHVWHILGQKELHATIKILPPLAPLPGENRKELAARTHEVMNKEFRRIR